MKKIYQNCKSQNNFSELQSEHAKNTDKLEVIFQKMKVTYFCIMNVKSKNKINKIYIFLNKEKIYIFFKYLRYWVLLDGFRFNVTTK